MRYKIIIEYDGSYFSGWQWQKDRDSVQSVLSAAILELTKEQVVVEGAGRTDAGVHATGQCAHFDLKKPWIPFKLQSGLNFFLRNRGAAILSVDYADHDWHARFSAKSRKYKYIILNRFAEPIIDKDRVWHVRDRLNFDIMKSACKDFIGQHDFGSFRAASCQASSPIRTLSEFDMNIEDKRIVISIKAKSFLHNQVRIMVGTLKQIGDGSLAKDCIKNLLQNPNRCASGITAPPSGLYLVSVGYD